MLAKWYTKMMDRYTKLSNLEVFFSPNIFCIYFHSEAFSDFYDIYISDVEVNARKKQTAYVDKNDLLGRLNRPI